MHPLMALIEQYHAFDRIPFHRVRMERGLLHLFSNPHLGGAWLLVRGDAVLGYFVLTFAFDLEFGGRVGTVTELFVVPEARKQGLGRQLIAAAESVLQAEGIEEYELQVSQHNAGARAFYARLGFTAFDRIPMSKAVPRPNQAQRTTARNTYTVRPAQPQETDALVAIGKATGLFTDDEANALLRDTLHAIHQGMLPPSHRANVAISATAEVPIGWVYFAPKEGTNAVWELFWIGVDPKHHGKGVGAYLLHFVETEVRTAGGRLLLVETSSTPALAQTRGFYRQHGYVECGLVPDFYGPGDGKSTFAKPLMSVTNL